MSDDLDDEDIFGDETLAPQEVRQALVTGLTITDLSALFRLDDADVRQRLASVSPIGNRRGRPIYNTAEAAQYLVKPVVDVEAYIKKMKPKDLPPSLQKAFWDAQKSRQAFEEEAGHLWHTARVQEVIVKLMGLTRRRLVLGADFVDRMAPLNEEQRRLVQKVFDETLSSLQAEVIEAFKGYSPEGDRQEVFENGPPKPAYVMAPEDDEDDGLGDGLDL